MLKKLGNKNKNFRRSWCSNLSNDDIISNGCENDTFWPEIGPGLGEPRGTSPPRIPRSTPGFPGIWDGSLPFKHMWVSTVLFNSPFSRWRHSTTSTRIHQVLLSRAN